MDTTEFQTKPYDFIKSREDGSLDSVGGGYYSEVYDGTFPGTVVKTTYDIHRDKDGWLVWATFCMLQKRASKYTPKVHAITIDLVNNKMMALMEKLTEQSLNDTRTRLRGFDLHRIIPSHTEEDARPPAQAINVLKSCVKWMDTVLPNAARRTTLDAHAYNWMMRGDTVVCTDPFAGVDYDPVDFVRAAKALNPNLNITILERKK